MLAKKHIHSGRLTNSPQHCSDSPSPLADRVFSSGKSQDSNRSIVMVEDEEHMTVWYNCAVMLLGLLETLALMLDLFKACSVGTTKVEELTPDTTFLYGGTSTCFKKVRGQENSSVDTGQFIEL